MTPNADDRNEDVRCFLSYSRDDSAAMNHVADEIKFRVEALYRAQTGKRLAIFVDRHDIGWGTDWREQISESVRNATAFIPLITMDYFNRQACREELMAFYNNAKLRGVTELILPIILAGSRLITDADPREEVRVIERLQYKNLETLWPRGYTSAEWLTAMSDVTASLIAAVEKAENSIATAEGLALNSPAIPAVAPTRRTVKNGGQSDDGDGEADESETDLFSLMSQFGEESAAFGERAPTAMRDLQDFTIVIQDLMDQLNSAPDNKTRNQRAVAASNGLLEVSTRLGDSGTELLGHISLADAALRQIIAEVSSFDIPGMKRSLRDSLQTVRDLFKGSEGLPQQMDEMAETIRFAQRFNVSLRRAFAPAYKGMSAMRDVVHIMKAWDGLVVSLED